MPVPLGRIAAGRATAALPDPLKGLVNSRYKVKLYRGELVMLAGPAGAGKTTMALIMAIRTGASCLYFSADSDDLTMAARAASVVTRHSTSAIREAQEVGAFEEIYGSHLQGLPIRFVFDPSEPSAQDMSHALEAYHEMWATYPDIIIVDNLWNTSSDTGEEWSGMRGTMRDLHFMARRTKSSLWVLHHTLEREEKDKTWISSAPPRTAIQGKLSQLPSLILTMANDEGIEWVAVVKWRHGPSDPKAQSPLRMVLDFSRNVLFDEPMMASSTGGNT